MGNDEAASSKPQKHEEEMKYEMSGTVRLVFETKQVSDRFKKREFVIDVEDGKYKQCVLLQSTGDRCDDLDKVSAGDSVRVNFNIKGREWNSPSGETKYFTTLEAWRVEVTSKGAGTSQSADWGPGNGNSDLPF